MSDGQTFALLWALFWAWILWTLFCFDDRLTDWIKRLLSKRTHKRIKPDIEDLKRGMDLLQNRIKLLENIKNTTCLEYNIERIKNHVIKPVFSVDIQTLVANQLYLEVLRGFFNGEYLIVITYFDGHVRYYYSRYFQTRDIFSVLMGHVDDASENSRKIDVYKIEWPEMRFKIGDGTSEVQK